MRAGTLTLRIGTQLVGLRADTAATLTTLRTLLDPWVDDAHPDVPWTFDVQLDPHATHDHADTAPTEPAATERTVNDRAVRPLPQLRLGQLLFARSRDPGDVLRALACVLGGALARQDDSRLWSALRTLHRDGAVVLLDAQRPTLIADPTLRRAGIDELPTWTVAIEGRAIDVPPPLADLQWSAIGVTPPTVLGLHAELAGIVALDPTADSRSGGDVQADVLSRFAALHPSVAWFSTVEQLVRDERITVSSDRTLARLRIVELLGR